MNEIYFKTNFQLKFGYFIYKLYFLHLLFFYFLFQMKFGQPWFAAIERKRMANRQKKQKKQKKNKQLKWNSLPVSVLESDKLCRCNFKLIYRNHFSVLKGLWSSVLVGSLYLFEKLFGRAWQPKTFSVLSSLSLQFNENQWVCQSQSS